MLKLIEITSQAIKNHSESNIKLQIHQALDEDIRKIEEFHKDPNYKIKHIVNQEIATANNEVDPLLIILGISFFSFSANLILLFTKSINK